MLVSCNLSNASSSILASSLLLVSSSSLSTLRALLDVADTIVETALPFDVVVVEDAVFVVVVFVSLLLLDVLLQGLKGLGDLAGLDSSSAMTLSSICSNLLFFNGAVLGSCIFLGSASFLLFLKEIGITCTSTLSSEALGECKPDMSSSSPPLQNPASLSEPAITPAATEKRS